MLYNKFEFSIFGNQRSHLMFWLAYLRMTIIIMYFVIGEQIKCWKCLYPQNNLCFIGFIIPIYTNC